MKFYTEDQINDTVASRYSQLQTALYDIRILSVVVVKNVFHETRTRSRFLSGERHTCHARLLAFVSRLTNGLPHMARRARLRPDFGPAAAASLPRSCCLAPTRFFWYRCIMRDLYIL